MVVFLLIVFVVLMAIFGPLATIWSLNFLFGLTIPYTFKAWLAIACLAAALKSAVWTPNK